MMKLTCHHINAMVPKIKLADQLRPINEQVNSVTRFKIMDFQSKKWVSNQFSYFVENFSGYFRDCFPLFS